MKQQVTLIPPKVPLDFTEWKREVKSKLNIHDHVEHVHGLLMTGDVEQTEKYVNFMSAIQNKKSVEGSLRTDQTLAAQMVQNRAGEISSNHPLVHEQIHTIEKSLNVVWHRFRKSRNDLRKFALREKNGVE